MSIPIPPTVRKIIQDPASLFNPSSGSGPNNNGPNSNNNRWNGADHQTLYEIIGSLPFWIWDTNDHIEQHKQKEYVFDRPTCCFTHFVGQPLNSKTHKPQPWFPYQKRIFDLLENKQNLVCLKATGIGFTTLMLYYYAWKPHTDIPRFKNSMGCIITGPRIDLSIELVDRMKQILSENLPFNFTTKESIMYFEDLNMVIQAFPSNSLNSMRGQPKVSFVLMDEAAFFRESEQKNAREITERYIGKSNPQITIVSTPNRPDDLLYQIWHEEPSIYQKVAIDYRQAEGYIFSKEDIEAAKKTSGFAREYDLQFSGIEGNVFSQQAIDWSITNDIIEPNPYSLKSIGIDPGFGSSAFGICVTQFNNGRIEILYADEFNRSSYEDMVNLFWELKEKYQQITNVYVDASFPAIIKTLKKEVGEADDWEYVKKTMDYCKKNHMDIEDAMVVVPVPFGNNGGVELLQNAKMLLEDSSQLVKIPKSYEKMITALRTAWAEDFRLDKEQTSYDDLLDAFRLALWKYKLRK